MRDNPVAKPILYEKCVKNGMPSLPYDDFGDIRRCLEKDFNHGFSKPLQAS